jgi:brefeldin A-inhibited guanine nucleotide-exchange protein
MSETNEFEAMDEVSLGADDQVQPRVPEQQEASEVLPETTPEQVRQMERPDLPAKESTTDVNLDEPHTEPTEHHPESILSPPPVPDKQHELPSRVFSPSSSLPSPQHRSQPSLSLASGGIYRAGTPASASRTSFSAAPHLSLALIKPGLELIAQSKEAKRSPALMQAAQRALELCSQDSSTAAPKEILEPLKLACELQVDRIVTPALDLIAKLVSHGFFCDEVDRNHDGPSLADIITHIITTSYTETSSPAVAVQVVKSLLAIVLSSTLSVHQSSLLKAVRTVYNVYLLSADQTTQLVAQGSLTQMIHHIFGRVKRRKMDRALGTASPGVHGRNGSLTPVPGTATPGMERRESSLAHEGNGADESEKENGGNAALTLYVGIRTYDPSPNSANLTRSTRSDSFSAPNPNDNIPLDVSAEPGSKPDGLPLASQELNPDLQIQDDSPSRGLTLDQLYVKDAFLVLRALCKLTMKPLLSER